MSGAALYIGFNRIGESLRSHPRRSSPITKHLTAIGNSLGLIIEKPILELLNITRETPLEVTTDGVGLFIRPIRENHPPKSANQTNHHAGHAEGQSDKDQS